MKRERGSVDLHRGSVDLSGRRQVDYEAETKQIIEDQDSRMDPASGGSNGSDAQRDMNVVAAYKAHFREDPFGFMQQVWAYGKAKVGEGECAAADLRQ